MSSKFYWFLLTLILGLFICDNLKAQKLTPWSIDFDQIDNPIFHDALPIDSSLVLIAGSAGKLDQQKGAYFIFDNRGKLVNHKIISEVNAGQFLAISRLDENHFLLAGKASMKQGMDEQGWIICINSDGEICWQFLEQQKKSEFTDIIQLEAGEYLAIGRATDTLLFRCLNREGNVLRQDFERLKRPGLRAESICKAGEDTLILLVTEKSSQKSMIWKLAPSSEKTWIIVDSLAAQNWQARDIVEGINGTLLLPANNIRGRQTGQLLKFDPLDLDDHSMLEVESRDRNYLSSICSLTDSTYLLLGSYFPKGAHRSQIWLKRSLDFTNVRETDFRLLPGDKYRNSTGTKLIPWNFGEFLVLASQEINGNPRAELALLHIPDLKSPARIVIDSIVLVSAAILAKPDEKSKFKVYLRNCGEKPSPTLLLQAQTLDNKTIESEIIDQILPSKRIPVDFGVPNDETSVNRELVYRFTLLNQEKEELTAQLFTVNNFYYPELKAMIPSKPQVSQKNNTMTLRWELKNFGVDTILNPKLSMTIPEGIISQDTILYLNSISPRESTEVQVDLTLEDQYQATAPSFEIKWILEDDAHREAYIKKMTVEHSRTFVNINWIDSHAHGDTSDIARIQLLYRVQSNESISENEISFFQEGKKMTKPTGGNNPKTDIVPLLVEAPNTFKGSQIVDLEPGANHFKIQVTLNDLIVDTYKTIHYEPKPDLYVLAYGITFEDLSYTTNDARDFSGVLNQQKGLHFDSVFIEIFASPLETGGREIINSVYEYSQLWSNKVKSNDLCVLYFSTHASIENDDLILRGTPDPDRPDDPLDEVDFKKYLLKSFVALPCQKLVILDACQRKRGNLPVEKSAYTGWTIPKDDDRYSSMSFLLSCRSGENSFESEVEKNGIFTQAILDAFTGNFYPTLAGINRADEDDNGYITVKELEKFLELRVPVLVPVEYQIYSQTPKGAIPDEHRDLILYQIRKDQ